MTSRRPRGEDGAYAILYALLLLVVLGTAAIVVDLAAMREDRRQSKLASDAAAVAGVRSLDPIEGGNPFEACEETWSYVSTNMDVPVASPTGCTVFPTAFTTCPTIASTATATSEGVTVTVTWPVLQTSPLLTGANVQGGTVVQAVDPAVDGTDACTRLGVSITQVHEQLLAGLFGGTDTKTTVTSVARAMANPGTDQAIAALNVLNPTTCEAIDMSGQAFLLIGSVGTRPGIISVESSGRQQNGVCPNSADWVINAADNSSGGYIDAQGPGNVPGGGIIYSYALQESPTGNPPDAYNPSLVPPSNTLLRPKPTMLAQRSGQTPITNYLQCTGTCTTVPENYIGLLQTTFGGSGAPTAAYPYADTPYDSVLTSPFRTLPGSAVPSFSCTIGNNARVLVPAGNWFVNCPGANGLRVQGRLVFAGGTIVTAGGIDVAGGCFAANVPLSQPTPPATLACPGVSGGDVTTPPLTAAMIYMRSGNLTTSGVYSILLPRTFVYMGNGTLDLGSNATNVFWTNPRVTNVLCVSDECVSQRFAKVALWNTTTSNSGSEIGGQGSLTLRGVMFMPNMKFTYTGQAAQVQTNAQFWTDRIEVSGQGGLTMAPDPTDSFATPVLGVALIR